MTTDGANVTAIFAYVKGSCAVVAADSYRADPSGMLGPKTVNKAYCWADRIPFACTGNGALMSKLATDMIALSTKYPSNEFGFRAAFQRARTAISSAAPLAAPGSPIATGIPALKGGTILASIPEEDGTAARILELNFDNGNIWPHPCDLTAQGADPEAFRTIGLIKYNEHKGPTGLACDVWAVESIALASDICARHVSLPCDVIITRPDSTGRYVSQHEHFHRIPVTPNAAFKL